MTKMQGILILVAFCLLTACNAGAPTITGVEQIFPAGTQSPTPFQAHSPTPRPLPTASPTMLPSPTPLACLQEGGTVEEKEIEFRPGNPPYAFRLYLPPCYEEQEDPNYPVLVMIHGQTFADDQWDRLGIDEAADALIAEGKARPFLIVMPRERDTFGDIYASPFARGLIEDLLPWIDANYPTCADRSCRAIGGLSRGGAWALRLGMEHWEVFGAIGMHSTPPFIGDRETFLPRWLAAIPADELPRIYMDTGRQDWYLVATSRLEQYLVQAGVPHEWYLFNGTHDEAYWSAHVTDYLGWYTRPWQE